MVIQFLAACSGPVCVLYAIHVFEKNFELGKVSTDATHTVLVKNHGEYRYVTEADNHRFQTLLAIGVVLVICMLLAIAYERLKKETPRETIENLRR